MQFESKQKRTFWFNAAFGLVPDTIISAVLAAAFDRGIPGFVLAFFVLQILYFLIWIKNSIWAWTIFKLNGQKHLVSQLTDYLKKNNFPEPDDYENSAESYFSSVSADENQPVGVRLKAAASLAEMNFMPAAGQHQNHIRVSIAYEDALENHKRTFTRPGQ